eukprot:762550-Hanusia_phi.AAC.9
MEVYFDQHGLKDLFYDLTQDLAFHRPQDPKKFLHGRLAEMIGAVSDQKAAVGEEMERSKEMCYLKMYIESSGVKGTVTRHFSRREASKTISPLALNHWKMEANSKLEEAVNESMGAKTELPKRKEDEPNNDFLALLAELTSANDDIEDTDKAEILLENDQLKQDMEAMKALIDRLEKKVEFAKASKRRLSKETHISTTSRQDIHSYSMERAAQGISYKKNIASVCDESPHSGCWLRIIFVNDVYELKNLPQFDSVIRHHGIPNTIVMLPGDFLAPSLLSSLDKGKGMMDMLNRVGGCGVQYVCFGNHETDIPVSDLRERIKEYKGKWINSNMRDFEPSLPEYDVIEVKAGGQTRRVGIIGLLTTDKNLYQKGAFGGAMETAAPVYETAARLRKKLMEEEGCDVVIPMTHQVMAEDREMARLQMGFPLLVAAHDHDPYVETIEGCTIVKTGMDAENAAIVDILWESGETPGERPKIKVEL